MRFTAKNTLHHEVFSHVHLVSNYVDQRFLTRFVTFPGMV